MVVSDPADTTEQCATTCDDAMEQLRGASGGVGVIKRELGFLDQSNTDTS